MNPRLRDECLCGECGPCRRALREAAYIPPTPVTLGEKARAILAEPVGTPYTPRSHREPGVGKPRAVIDRNSNGKLARPRYTPTNPADAHERQLAAQRRWRERNRTIVKPEPCARCGQLRALKPVGSKARGQGLSGKGDLCEICCEQDWINEFFAAHIPGQPRTAEYRTKLRKAQLFSRRVLRDGRAYAPDAPNHGTTNGYGKYGCRCEPCCDAKANYNHQWKAAKAS